MGRVVDLPVVHKDILPRNGGVVVVVLSDVVVVLVIGHELHHCWVVVEGGTCARKGEGHDDDNFEDVCVVAGLDRGNDHEVDSRVHWSMLYDSVLDSKH
jgi:hypothetical protein